MVIFKVQCVELTKVHTKVMEAMQNILNSVLEQKSNQTTRLHARLKGLPLEKRRSSTIGWKRFYEKACNRFGNANVTHVAILSYGQVGLVDSQHRVLLQSAAEGKSAIGKLQSWLQARQILQLNTLQA